MAMSICILDAQTSRIEQNSGKRITQDKIGYSGQPVGPEKSCSLAKIVVMQPLDSRKLDHLSCSGSQMSRPFGGCMLRDRWGRQV